MTAIGQMMLSNQGETAGARLPNLLGPEKEGQPREELRPNESFAVEICVGIGMRMVLVPRWREVKQLGRCLVVFKCHLMPEVCELFFMPVDYAITTYTSME